MFRLQCSSPRLTSVIAALSRRFAYSHLSRNCPFGLYGSRRYKETHTQAWAAWSETMFQRAADTV